MTTTALTPRALEYIKAAQAVLAKTDGRDKLVATLQYAAMFAAAGSPGALLNAQKSLSNARKPFRALKPVEALLPLLTAPPGVLTPVAAANKLKAVSWAIFFTFDHVVWAHAVGFVTNKDTAERAQRTSFYGWLLASLCTLAVDLNDIAKLHASREKAASALAAAKRAEDGEKKKEGEGTAAVEALRVADDALRTKFVNVASTVSQAAVAASLLKLIELGPRKTAMFGLISSIVATYQLMPPLPPMPTKSKAE